MFTPSGLGRAEGQGCICLQAFRHLSKQFHVLGSKVSLKKIRLHVQLLHHQKEILKILKSCCDVVLKKGVVFFLLFSMKN